MLLRFLVYLEAELPHLEELAARVGPREAARVRESRPVVKRARVAAAALAAVEGV